MSAIVSLSLSATMKFSSEFLGGYLRRRFSIENCDLVLMLFYVYSTFIQIPDVCSMMGEEEEEEMKVSELSAADDSQSRSEILHVHRQLACHSHLPPHIPPHHWTVESRYLDEVMRHLTLRRRLLLNLPVNKYNNAGDYEVSFISVCCLS